MPIGTARATAIVMVRNVSQSVGSMRWPIIVVTGRPVNTDTPRSPCSSRHTHEKNCSKQRLVEAQQLAEPLDVGGAGRVAGDQRRRIAGRQVHQQEHDHGDDAEDRDHRQDAPQDVEHRESVRA